MAEQKAKKLTLGKIKSQVKDYDKKVRVDLDEETYINIYPNFAPAKLDEMYKELVSDIEQADKKKLDIDKFIEDGALSYLLMIKHFTDLSIPKEIDKKLQALVYLVDSDYYNTIMANFPVESIEKLTEYLSIRSQQLNSFMAMTEEEKSQVLGNVKLPDHIEEQVKQMEKEIQGKLTQ